MDIAPEVVSPAVLDGFAKEFENLAIKIPTSVRATVKKRLLKRGVDPADPQTEEHKAVIIGELATATDRYKIKSNRAKVAAKAKRDIERDERIAALNAAAALKAQELLGVE